MSLNTKNLVNALASHAMTLGRFERVNGHEPKNAPGSGLSCAIWLQYIGPARGQSGLKATTGRVVASVRVYSNMLAEPQDAIDPEVGDAVDALMAAYSNDFELGGLIRNVDLLGATGVPLQAEAGYISIDKQMFRVMTIQVPMIINDIWEQDR